jgi:hypothetical protein
MANENDSRSVNMTNKRQFSDITNQHLNQIEEDKDALNTKRSTELILLHFVECDMMCYVELKSNIDQGRKSRSILLFSAP